MRFEEYLTLDEISLSKPAKIKVDKSSKDQFRTSWITDEVDYEFQADRSDIIKYGQKIGDIWNINFAPAGYRSGDKTKELDIKSILQVFSSVNTSLNIFIKKTDPGAFQFSPLTEKLAPIYVKMARKLSKSLKGYDYKWNGHTHLFTKGE